MDVDITKASVHALLGGNGSGKSTFIKILAGIVPADPQGTIRTPEKVYDAREFNPHAARKAGLRFVHQDLGLFDDLTVAENIALVDGFPKSSVGVAWRRLHREVNDLLGRFSVPVSARERLGDLPAAMKTMVAVARALRDEEASVLVLDEPTASLPPQEVEQLLSALRTCRDNGQTIIYVSHRLEEVAALADEATVLRDGQVVGRPVGQGLTQNNLAALMSGTSDRRPALRRVDPPPGSERLSISESPDSNVKGITIHAGEIVGISGLADSGVTSMLRSLYGAREKSTCCVTSHTGEAWPTTTYQAAKQGIAYVPRDRLDEGIYADLSVRENLMLPHLNKYWSLGRFQRQKEKAEGYNLMHRHSVRAPDLDSPAYTLSGGNQQKIVIARAISTASSVLLLDEPTQGVDVAARADIHNALREATTNGTSILVASTDFEELSALCDRIILLDKGHLLAELPGGTPAATILETLYSSLETEQNDNIHQQ
ncbi:sugar ABC transporter ATP-binding protein [Arthrobacter sp. Cr_A7]|uniref:sugar ABC transporter ATP-binding protein n=1 Tax=Arthrobacter sp. Cr_A7 TaxID=3031017 RepID=UPI0023DA9EE8|nr:sugar ABC transporter ATP-binding protein [Arthrobacter sp. Cr_A7]MDF2052232.1 sugar ABC transporter ATP-binding protein [Arthrobacter sp. Cr_A7]